nr:hypothetical protein [Tanacetum cinerariifolium]
NSPKIKVSLQALIPLVENEDQDLPSFFFFSSIAVQTSSSGISILLTVAFIFRQWEVPSGSGNFLTNISSSSLQYQFKLLAVASLIFWQWQQSSLTVGTYTAKRTVRKNCALWSDKLDDALWAFRTAFKTPIGCTPYKLVYGESSHLPIELEHKAYWALKHVNFDLKTAGKLKTRWLGPFTITQVFPYGTVELSQPNGPNFKVNGHRVKHYFGGDIPSKVVPDLHTIPMDK